MPASVFVGALAIGVSIPLLWWGAAGTRRGRGEGLLTRFLRRGESTTDLRELALAESASSRVVFPALKTLVHRIRRVTPIGWLDSLEQHVVLAGAERTWPVEKILVVNAATAVLGGLLAVGQLKGGINLLHIITAGIMAGIGVLGPSILIQRRARMRQERIERDLPDALDQLKMGVEAGLGFEGALLRVAQAGKGPLAEEFTRALKEMHIGITRTKALRNILARTDVQDLSTFVVAIVQAEDYGLPIAQVLRVQAAELRLKRSQRAEERAMRVPVKLIFPLGLCIFPSLFIVLVAPGAIRIWRVLGL